jgi:hypothetical protein
MRCALILVQEYGDPDEKFVVLEGQSQELFSFQDLKFIAGCQNVAIIPSDGLSSNAALRRQYAMELLNTGFFGAPGAPDFKSDLFAKFAGIKMPGLVPDPSDSEVQAALAAIKQLEDGYGYQPYEADDADTFSRVLMDWLRVTGRRLRFKNPQLVQQVSDLWKYYMNQMMMAQAQQAGAAPPGAPVGRGPSQSGSQSTAPGGTPNGAGGSTSAQADQTVANADQAAEQAVRSNQAHEG